MMSSIDNYQIKSTAASLMPDHEYQYHNHHYKDGKNKFDAWIREVRGYSKQELYLNYYPTMARAFVREQGVIPDTYLYYLQKWLRGRQVCYYHHLQKGDANNEHLHPITIALELIRVLRPYDSEAIVAGCTPVNLRTFVKEHGTERARELYACPRSSDRRSRSPIHDNGIYPDYYPPMSECKPRHHSMSRSSWRRTSDSSEEARRGRVSSISSSTSSLSSATSFSGLETPRSPSTSPNTSPKKTPQNYASAAGAWSPSPQQSAKSQGGANPSTSGSGKLVLMTKAARGRSTSR